jgi:tellurite resistance protein
MNEQQHLTLTTTVTPAPGLGSPWLARFPVGLFAVCVGLFALAGTLRRAGALDLPWAVSVSDVVAAVAGALLVLLSTLYVAKAVRFGGAVKAEANHPLGSSMVALLPLAYLLAVTYYGQAGQTVWLVPTLAAIAAHGYLSYRLVARLTTGTKGQVATTPALYLAPVGGGLVGAMAMAGLGYTGWAAILLGVGVASWALLEMRVLNTMFEGPLPLPMRPTIGLEMAPPTVATLAAAVIWTELPAQVLLIGLGVSLVSVMAVLARYKWWREVPFATGFWAFAFPISAFSSDIILAVQRGGWPPAVGWAALALAIGVVALLVFKTLQLAVRGKLIP